MKIIDVCDEFKINGSIIKINKQANGLINNSYIINTTSGDYIIQRINKNVFKNPIELMENIEKTIKYLNKNNKICCNELYLIPTKVGNNCLIKNNEYYRCYNFIKDSVTYEKIINNKQIYELGKIIGRFQKDLNGLPTNELSETIKDFHNTKKRYSKLIETYKESNKNLQAETIDLYLMIIKYENLYSSIVDKLEKNEIPYRVVHNDTKLNNVIFNKKTNKAMCLIDFDTIMPGSMLYDFGDALRSSASSTEEDDKNIKNVYFDEKLFIYFVIGFYYNVKDIITYKEIDLLVDSIFIITMECAIRFLTDYLEGNVYFKVLYEKHNLIRARNQIALANDIYNKKEKLKRIIKNVVNRFENN